MIISVGNVKSKIIECSQDEYILFRDALSFMKQGAWFNPAFKSGAWDGKEYLFSGKSFSTGNLQLVIDAVPDVIIRKSRLPRPLKANPTILKTKHMKGKYAYQLKGVQAVLNKRRGILHFATNAGKTAIAASFIKTINKPTLFLVDKKELMLQASETFREETGLEVGVWGSGKDTRAFITVGMVQTIYRQLKKKEARDWLANIEVVVIDETHGSGAKTFLKTLEQCTSASYRVGLSGTPLTKSNLENAKVKSQLGEVIARISNEDLIKLKVSAKPIVTMIKIDQKEAVKVHKILSAENTKIDKAEKKIKIYPKVYEAGIVENKLRNGIAVKLIRKLLTKQHTILILVKRVKHGTIIKEMLNKQGIKVAFCHGESTDEEREKEISAIKNRESNILILSKIGQIGLDIPYLSSGIYLTAGKSEVEVVQSIGRYLRLPEDGAKEILFYDFYDKDSYSDRGYFVEGYLEKHSEIRKGYYEQEGFETTVMDFSELGKRL